MSDTGQAVVTVLFWDTFGTFMLTLAWLEFRTRKWPEPERITALRMLPFVSEREARRRRDAKRQMRREEPEEMVFVLQKKKRKWWENLTL